MGRNCTDTRADGSPLDQASRTPPVARGAFVGRAPAKDDGLLAYALAAYFLEGRPKDLEALLSALDASRTNQHEALAEVLGIDARVLQYRFVRWLREIPVK